MTTQRPELLLRERMAIRLMILCGWLAVGFWAMRIGCHDFSEPMQVAVVGHDALWRQTKDKRHVLTVGTNRKTNDLVVYDRKASPSHFQLTRRGAAGRWWAALSNRSDDREIVLHRGDKANAKGPARIALNRYKLRHMDRFLVPVSKAKGVPQKPKDSCSPTAVFQWLRRLSQTPLTSQTPVTLVSMTVEETRQPFRVWRTRARMRWGKGRAARQVWLDESQRYELASASGKRLLAYRYGQWQHFLQPKGPWRPLKKPLGWGKPARKVELVRDPSFTFAPAYRIGLTRSPCRWPLQPKVIPAGLSLAGVARLNFTKGRLALQHLGQVDVSLQIVPHNKTPRRLGTATLFSGDLISIGQLTYRATIEKQRVRLMLTRLPQSFVFPLHFFASYPSEHYPMRRLLPLQKGLLLTGGEGATADLARWRIPLSLRQSASNDAFASPYRAFLQIDPQTNKSGQTTWKVAPPQQAAVYLAKSDGTLLPKRLTQAVALASTKGLFYSNSLYLRVFRPSYEGLSRQMALLWALFAGLLLLLLGRMMLSGRIPLRPLPLVLPATPAPSTQHSHPLVEPQAQRRQRPGWLWLGAMMLLPVALFLNGLGLYILATLSLSSLGLNNNSFLYRQMLWSLVGLGLFVLALSWSSQSLRSISEALQRLPLLGALLRWWRERRTEAPQKVVVMGVDNTPKTPWRQVAIGAVIVLVIGWVMGALLQSSMIVVPLLLVYGYGLLIQWEWRRSYHDPKRRQSLRYFFLTLLLLGTVPVIGLILPPLVHNRFFLKIPGIGTVKLSDFAIIAAILFFASYLGTELFAIRKVKAKSALPTPEDDKDTTPSASPMIDESSTLETPKEAQATGATTEAEAPAVVLPAAEASRTVQRFERLGGALSVSFLYLLLLGAIGVLYTAQGDLGPGLILTLCFSLFLLFAFIGSGADRLTTIGNLIRIAIVFGGLLLLVGLPSVIATLFPGLAESSSELQKVQERLALWNQPWRYLVGEQILQNLWDLAGYKGSFQWFNNLHSDFVLTAVVGVLSPMWGALLIGLTCLFPLSALALARLYWHPLSSYDSPTLTARKQRDLIRSLVLLFGGIYLFAQNFIHIGSVLRLTPMTGVTFTWVSSGGTSLVVCYLVLAMMYRQMRAPEEAQNEDKGP